MTTFAWIVPRPEIVIYLVNLAVAVSLVCGLALAAGWACHRGSAVLRHGILVSGQAYQSLPQVLLELDGDDIYAVGMFGLIYGRYDNLIA